MKSIDYKNIYYPPGGILLWILIFLELITFGAVLLVFVANGRDNLEMYHQSRHMLNPTFGAINTIFLLTSGFFMANTITEFKTNNIKKASFYLNLTMIGGLLFLLLKSVEYYFKIADGHTLGYNTYLTFYWLLTGFHVIHVIVGLVILVFMRYSLKKGKAELEDIEAGGAFWHMCDLIWLLLFPTLYLIF